jgi:hypothetical protein
MIDLATLRRVHRHRIAPRLRRKPPATGPVPLLLGITGHRDIPPGDVAPLEAAFRGVLRDLETRCPHTGVTLLSGLAGGADQLAASVAFADGIPVIACLPLPLDDYAKDFDEAGAARLRDMVARCEAVHVTSESGGERSEAYLALGKFLNRFSQVLVAFWDGVPSDKRGGTADVIARRKGLWSDGDSLEPPDVGPLFEIATPRESTPRPATPYAVTELFPARFPGDARAKNDAVNELEALDTYNEDLATARATRTDVHEAETIRLKTDLLAGRLQRTTLRFQNILYITAFVVAATQVVTFDPWTTEVRIAALGCLFLAFGLAKLFDYENRYQDYRAIGEGLRVQLAWWSAGIDDNVDHCYLRMQETELRWIRMVLRTICLLDAPKPRADAPIAAVVPRTNATLEGVRSWVRGQCEYFKAAARREARARRGYDLVATVVSGLCGFVGLVAGLSFITSRIGHAVQHWLVLGTSLGVLFVVLLHRYMESRSYQVNAERYGRMAILFQRAREALERPDLSQERGLALTRELGRDALAEQAEWLLIRRTQPLSIVETPAISG